MKPSIDNESKKDGNLNADSRFNQTLKSVQGLLSGKSFPGRVLLSRRAETRIENPQVGNIIPERPNGDNDFVADSSDSGSYVKVESYGPKPMELSEERQNPSANHTSEVPPKSTTSGTLRLSSGGRSTDSTRIAKFKKELSAPVVDLDALRELAWSGVPSDMRPLVWRLLLGYAPTNSDRREMILTRKRLEYVDCVAQYYDASSADKAEDELHTLRQISVDCPRTVPDVAFFHQPVIQACLERILYIWAIRHPASGYVQGINDLATPFLVVFLSEHIEGEMEDWVVSKLTPAQLSNVEADCYWCLSKLLDNIQDHYTFAQPGIQRLVFKLKELVRRIDEPVAKHMEKQGLEFLQFAFRWVNCLLIREIPFLLVTRLWDTYLAEGDKFPDFLVYACASFLLTWTEQLQKLDFQEMVLFLQHLPTKRWTHQELEMVLSRAFMWRVMFDRAPSHLNCN
ncbi:hypothetical protein KP509_07G073400 [Ceratopteris richardii]|uniref:Rab-GAP TBC domain-containing protein n=3 Tax=Ceratopteris richardii TaxID=49495 RepID=A0A8T2UC51_CERRI|nr:hypothetical protein KP509_07G073400 [Ceratopteris richardii]KAH7433524.1 hypothetical protein KP509_07G073400 [Ceratopteris richardii]KAH7433527.1 hypothetical protein KP509_07G073400 [Ceratopteris richardii]